MWATVGAGGLTAFGTSFSAPPFALILAGTVTIVLFAAILRKTFSYRIGVGLLLAPLNAYALAILVRSGFVPNATSVFVMMAIVAALLLGSRWALALTAVATLTLPIVWLGHHVGALDSLRVRHLYAAVTPDNWPGILRIALSYACISSVCVVAVSYLLDRAEEALSAKSRALEELRRQQVEADRLRASTAARRGVRKGARAGDSRSSGGQRRSRLQQCPSHHPGERRHRSPRPGLLAGGARRYRGGGSASGFDDAPASRFGTSNRHAAGENGSARRGGADGEAASSRTSPPKGTRAPGSGSHR
jgi:hypothetical protein